MVIRYLPSNRGFTLIELLIALAIGVLIAAAMASLYSQTLVTREQVNRTSQRIENGRYGLDVLSDDLRLAGYFGEFSTSGQNIAWTGATDVNFNPCPCAIAAPAEKCATKPSEASFSGEWNWDAAAPRLPTAVIGYEGNHLGVDAFDDSPTCLPNRKAGTDILAVRRLSSQTVLASSLATGGGVHMQVSAQTPFCVNKDDKGFTIGDAASELSLKKINCTDPAPARALVVRIYYVATCNVCSGADLDTTPTLKVAETSGGDFVIRSVVPGIDDLHVEYGVDSSGANGSADEYKLAGAFDTADNGKAWADVVSARVFLIARDLQDTPGYVNSESYVVGSKTVSAFNDARKRNIVSTTVRLNNVAGRRELPSS
jgi:type IV pilus assembly protein PilW